MRKFVIPFILSFAILVIMSKHALMVSAITPHDEINDLRKTIHRINDIDSETYEKLEKAILKKYNDVNRDDWYMSVMVKLAGLGSLDGTSINTLDPNGTVTKGMFIKMLIRAIYGTKGLENVMPDFEHWAAKDVKKAEDIIIVHLGEYNLNNLSEPITRGEMAEIIVRTYKTFEVNPLTSEKCMFLSTQIKDYEQMTKKQKNDALIVYGSGIITGYPNGNFAPNDRTNRAQAAAFIIRYLDKNERAKVEFPPEEKARPNMILSHDNPNRPMAIDGDTFIKPDGTRVVLKNGPSGVLGEEQGCAPELGRIDRGGVISEGDLGADEEFLGQPYLVCKNTGEGHYIREWHAIANAQRRQALNTLGHPEIGTTYGPWLRYSNGKWVWTGPV